MPWKSRPFAGARKNDGINVTIYLGAFMDIEMVVRGGNPHAS